MSIRPRWALPLALFTASLGIAAPSTVSIRWAGHAPTVQVSVDRGHLVSPAAAAKPGFVVEHDRLDLAIEPEQDAVLPTLVTVANERRGFTFRLGDVNADFPIFLPNDGVIITTSTDPRPYETVVAAIRARGTRTKLEEIAAAPEETFAHAATQVHEVKVQTWLGLSRDDRLFRVDEHLEWIQPRLSGRELNLPEVGNDQVTYNFGVGRGASVNDDVHRRLDDGVLPILHGTVNDETVRYELTMFTTLERQALTVANLRGTEYLLADQDSHGHSFTPAQKLALAEIQKTETFPDEETVLYARIVATNNGRTPQFAFIRTPVPSGKVTPKWTFDARSGLAAFDDGKVFLSATLDGRPLAGSEASPLLQPGESAVLEFRLPHRPVSAERARAVMAQSFEARLDECRAFWRGKLSTAAAWHVPEPRIDEMIRAGLLHLDLVAYGRNPSGPLLPAVGVYTAIGSESSPIIQFMDCMGWHETAARAIDYFLAKQHDDGFMQNFNGYMLETGAVVWTMGEHYRYTHDDAWLKLVHPNLTRACAYLQAWRKRNLQTELAGNGYGMLDGKTADPDDPYRSFMLNGYAYLAFARAAEMLAQLAPDEAATWRAEAETLKRDIRATLSASFERSPVVPLGDGTWVRAVAPWTLYRGPVMLHADGGRWFTHGSITSRDSLLGPLYLVFQEVVAPAEPMAAELLAVHSELMTKHNVAFSQPYYSRQPWLHLQRAEPKAFLTAWYNTVAAMADRETYTFTEHLFPVSAHKTHEEAWFLMQTRWMLYLEEGNTLRLLAGVPRSYLEAGQEISVRQAASYFGPLSFRVTSKSDGSITGVVDCPGARHPATVELRLPHPQGKAPHHVEGGEYNPARESVWIRNFTGHAEVTLRFAP